VASAEERRALEEELRGLAASGDHAATMTAAIQGYGAELYSFLAALARDHDLASDVFGAVCERLWKALPRFRWESSFRVWAYTIARNEFLRSTRTTSRERRQVPISQIQSIQAAVDHVRTVTAAHLRTEVKDAYARLRAELDPDDHMLLGLRVDRKMAWGDIARVLGSEGDAVERDAAALRKRFERLKKKLRELAASGP
jgi:RNA polymerase sigma-70 factor (ECF subfamily)